jgi:hypothetical protein
LRKLNTPIGPNNIEKLLMCVSIILDQELENLGGFEYEPILDIKLYISLEEKLRDTIYKSEKLSANEMERKHILHKLIFDSINENLDHKRVFGLRGLPMAYQHTVSARKIDLDRSLICQKNTIEIPQENFSLLAITQDDSEKILQEAQTEIKEWALCRNGFLIENCQSKRDLLDLEIRKESAMISVLKNYVRFWVLTSKINENEKKWEDLSDEILEVGLLVSERIFDDLVCDTVKDLLLMKQKF